MVLKKNPFRNIFFAILRFSLLPFVIRLLVQRKKITIIAYHDINPQIADKHFNILKKRYNIISLKNYLNAKRNAGTKILPQKSLIITFDDGNCGNYKLIPILKKYNIPATIFICSGIVGTNRHFWFKGKVDNETREFLMKAPDEERIEKLSSYGFEEEKEFENRQALSDKEIEEMKGVVDFQAHTILHPILTNCSLERTEREIIQCKENLKDRYKLDIYAFSYPNGDYSSREIEILKEAGYECAVTIEPGFNSLDTDVYKLKRIAIWDKADINELLVRTSGLWSFLQKLFKLETNAY